jgi:hypothetical protein
LFCEKIRKINMQFVRQLVLAIIMLVPFFCYAQNTDTLINKLDSLKQQTDTTGQKNLIEPAFYDERTKVNGRVFGILLLDDFKQQALSPLDINKRSWQYSSHWIFR